MIVRRRPHRYVGPRGSRWIDKRATRWSAVCACRWIGPERPSKAWAREDHVKHAIKEES